jgi:hypothetical protein
MSFAGHVFDMIQRDKQNREMLKYRRNRMKANRDKAYAKKTSYPNTNISSEVLEKIIKNKKERELEQERHFLFAQILFLGIVIIALLLIFGIRYFILKK